MIDADLKESESIDSSLANEIYILYSLQKKIILKLSIDKLLSTYDLAVELGQIPDIIRGSLHFLINHDLIATKGEAGEEGVQDPEIYLTERGKELQKLLNKNLW